MTNQCNQTCLTKEKYDFAFSEKITDSSGNQYSCNMNENVLYEDGNYLNNIDISKTKLTESLAYKSRFYFK